MAVVKSRSLLCVVVFMFFAPCNCLQVQLTSSHFDQGIGNKEAQASAEKFLPRKLRVLTEKVREYTEKDSDSKNYNAYQKILSDKLEQKKAKPRPVEGQTWQQWMDDGGDSSEFFTMDYSKVRRRRPIHNKGLPVGP
ncbi:hypothetical protein QQ045_001305 [Rhodiola kirilowii]